MTLYFAQQGPAPFSHGGPGWLITLFIPAMMIITGTVLGFRALNEIRHAGGAVGGAVLATFAAGLLPAAAILIVCGGGMLLVAEKLIGAAQGPKEELWVTLGVIAGLWISFLMMRWMHRRATGWVRPAPVVVSQRSQLSTAAIVLTIIGAATFLLTLLGAGGARKFGGISVFDPIFGSLRMGREMMVWQLVAVVSLLTLLSGLICGVLSRNEPAGKACTWTSGALFLALVLLIFA